MGHALVDHLKRGKLGNAKFVDATELVDQIMVIKSDEEIAKIRATAALQDRAMRAAFDAIKPGMRDIEVTAVAENFTRVAGAEYGLLMGASSPVGEPVMIQPRHLQNRVDPRGRPVRAAGGDHRPGRLLLRDRPHLRARQGDAEHEGRVCLRHARRRNSPSTMLKPGASCADVWNGYNEFMRRTAGRRRTGSIATARAITWWSGRWCASTRPCGSPRA